MVNNITESNKVLSCFLEGITGVHLNRSSTKSEPKKIYSLTKTIEFVHHTKDLTYISPIFFTENLVSYSATGSKLDVSLQGATSPSASYTTLMKWHETECDKALPVPTEDIVVAIDNDQLLSKNYRIQLNSKVSVSAITTLWAIQCEPSRPTKIQKRIDLVPLEWASTLQYGEATNEEHIISLFNKLDKYLEPVFHSYQNEILEQHIARIKNEQKLNQHHGTKSDKIDAGVPGID